MTHQLVAAASSAILTPMTASSSIRSLPTAAASGCAGKARAKGGCPLHACLLRHGITHLGPFSAPKHLGLSKEVVSSKVEPKLAALAAEGLRPAQMAWLLAAKRSPLSCSYVDTFQPNLELLQSILAFSEYQPHPQALQLTAVGRLLAGAPSHAAIYLSRDHAKVQELVRWLEGSLGISLAQLAGCKSLYQALQLAMENAHAVCSMLLGQGVPAEELSHVIQAQPTLFKYSPELLQARLGCLQQELGLDAAAALQLAVRHPQRLIKKV
jgi:hypothetical protein